MRECPGIYFATEPSGRPAKIACSQLAAAQINAALIYYARYRDEVRRRVDANAALTAVVLQQRSPGLVQVVTTG